MTLRLTKFPERSFYPSLSELNIGNELISSSLNLFTKPFYKDENDVKLHAIMHAIIQNIRPTTVIAPLQIGLAVEMHHHLVDAFAFPRILLFIQ